MKKHHIYIVYLTVFLIFLFIFLTGIRALGGGLQPCQEQVDCQIKQDLVLLNPVWIGLTGCLLAYCGLITFRYYRVKDKLTTAVDSLHLAESMNVFRYRIFRIAADSVQKTIDMDIYNRKGKIVDSIAGADDKMVYNWFENKGAKETIVNLLSLSECGDFDRIFEILRDNYGFQKAAGSALNMTKVIRRDAQKGKKEIYTEDQEIGVGNLSDYHLNKEVEFMPNTKK